MSKTDKTQKIKELTQKLSGLKEQMSKLNAEAREWAEKRNKLNEQFKNLRAETLELRSERDKLNEKVKELKQQRNKMKTEIREKIGEIKKLSQEIRALTKKKPSINPQTLQKKVESIEWTIQTTPLDLEEEKELVEQVKQLEIRLNIHRKLGKLNQKMLELQAELKAIETKNRHYHEKLTENAQKSQGTHERMLEKIAEAEELKMEADNLHQLFLRTKERTKPFQGKIIEILDRIKRLKEEIREEEEKEKKRIEEVLREKLEKRAREKLKRGEKLTWEEFQILAEKEMTAQD